MAFVRLKKIISFVSFLIAQSLVVQAQTLTCNGFTITGTTQTGTDFPSQGADCTVPFPISGPYIWTGNSSTGFIRHTFTNPQTSVSIWYTVANTDDVATINVNGGGTITITVSGGCANVNGSVVGPYTGGGLYGDFEVTIVSTQPFTQVTLVNTGGNSGFVSADCNAIVIDPVPVCEVNLGPDTVLCTGQTLLLDATIDGVSHLWSTNVTTPSIVVSEPGLYWVETSLDDCISRDSIVVTYSEYPEVNLGIDTTLCQNDQLILDATNTDATYVWNDNSTNATLVAEEAGIYWVIASIFSCTDTDSIEIDVNPLPIISLGADTTICQDDALEKNAAWPGASYLWSDNSTDSTNVLNSEGTFWVQLNLNNCLFSDSINITVNPSPQFDFVSDTTICDDAELLLDATTVDGLYLWQDSSLNATFNVTEEGVYWVEVTLGECLKSDTISVQLQNCIAKLEMPNVFTPNSDGLNEAFKPKVNEGIATMNTIIYNRWGFAVYQTNDLSINWDGSKAQEGTYFWVITYTDLKGNSATAKGNLLLLK